MLKSSFVIIFIAFSMAGGLIACKKADDRSTDELPIVDIAPQRAQLQKVKELEKNMQQDAEDQRKAIERQTHPQQ